MLIKISYIRKNFIYSLKIWLNAKKVLWWKIRGGVGCLGFLTSPSSLFSWGELSQRQNDHNYENNYEYLSLIADLLFTTVKELRMDKPKPEYRVKTTSLKGNLLLV